MSKPTTAFAAAALACLLAGCGPGKAPATPSQADAASVAPSLAAAAPGAGPAVDACSLLTAAQVEAATQVKVGQVKAVAASDAESGRCEYRHADTKSFGDSIVIAVSVFKPGKTSDERTVWGTYMKSTPVSGVGDFAYFNEAGGTIMAGRGDHGLTLQMLDGPPGAGRLAAIKRLAGDALGRL